MLMLLLSAILLACVAFIFNGGMWSSAVSLFNAIIAAILAMNFWEPLADFLDKQAPSWTYYWDVVSLWTVFFVSYSALRGVTDFVSPVKVRFKKPLDIAGSVLFSACIGWLMVCFTAMSLHLSPLPPDAMSAFPNPQSKMFFETEPDHKWLGFSQYVSFGPLSRSNPFDPQADFIFKYHQRRVANQGNTGKTGVR